MSSHTTSYTLRAGILPAELTCSVCLQVLVSPSTTPCSYPICYTDTHFVTLASVNPSSCTKDARSATKQYAIKKDLRESGTWKKL